MNFLHYGLYFTPAHVQAARDTGADAQEREPIAAAWAFLRGHEFPNADAALWGALRHRLTDSRLSAEVAAEVSGRWIDPALMAGQSFIEAVRDTAMFAHAYEMIRDFDGYSDADQSHWREAFAARIDALNTRTDIGRIDEKIWLMLVNLITGIVLEHEETVESACEAFRRTVAEDVSPRGYVEQAILGKDGGAMARQIRASGALVLMAEAAAHIGIDLWSYDVRGVSVMTTAVYPMYYFYTTAKWKWDADYPVENVQALFREYGGYLEILARRMQSIGTTSVKDVNVVLADLRPVYDARGGGLTTLTHAQPEAKPKRRGLFG